MYCKPSLNCISVTTQNVVTQNVVTQNEFESDCRLSCSTIVPVRVV